MLPGRVKGKLLWSPANTGPFVLRNQVVTIHDLAPLDHPEWMSRRFAAWYGWLTPRLAPPGERVGLETAAQRPVQEQLAHDEPGQPGSQRLRPDQPERRRQQ